MATKQHKKAGKKAKPSGPVATAVLWGLDPASEKGAAIRAVLRDVGVVARTLAPERLGDPAGACAGLVGFRPSPVPWAGEVPDCEFVLLCNLTNAQVNDFLAKSREGGCVVGAKALLTKQNKAWPMARLIAAVAAEHAQMTRGADAAKG